MARARLHRRSLRGTRRPHVAAVAVVAPPAEGDLTGAACKGLDPDLFFPEPDPDRPEWECVFEFAERRAKMICAGCPVRQLCLAGALERGEPAGIFGGLTADERAKLKRRTENQRAHRRRAEREAAGIGGAA
ncbi:WhiB family transcriptional regulator [Kitasatospora sp. NPDC059673]|uniref:WhiB family transcriptional regulator n=1 Tax=Kitasatospora sp. NPDC059673 TaxID=3346901 RepID=UPI0036BACC48